MMGTGKRIALAAIPSGGCSKGGDFVTFDLKAKDGRMFEFSCPHEAVSQIVESLLVFATRAQKERGGTDIDKEVGPQTAATRQLTSAVVGCSLDGKQIILKLQCGPVLRTSMAMPPEVGKTLSSSLAEAYTKCQEILAPQKGRAN